MSDFSLARAIDKIEKNRRTISTDPNLGKTFNWLLAFEAGFCRVDISGMCKFLENSNLIFSSFINDIFRASLPAKM